MAKVKCDIPQFTPINSLFIRISGGTSSIKPHYYEDELVSLEINNKIISQREILTIKNKPYKINIIEKKVRKNITYYNLKIAKRNKSSIFILPMLGGTKRLWFYNQLFINAFIGIKNKIENKIILLYRKSNDILFKKFKNALKQFRSFRSMEDVDDNYILFIFDIPTHHIKNFKLFKEGKYSKLNRTYKLKILDYHGLNVDNAIGQILFKTSKRKRHLEKKIGMYLPDDAELYSIPEKHEEHFNINYYL